MREFPQIVDESLVYRINLNPLLVSTGQEVASLAWGSSNEDVILPVSPPVSPTGQESLVRVTALAKGKAVLYCLVTLADAQAYIVRGRVIVDPVDE